MPFGTAIAEVFFGESAGEVDVVDVGQGAKPCDHVSKFFFEIAAVGAVQRGGELADFFDEPDEGLGCAALAVDLFIALGNVFLERGDGQVGGVHGERVYL